MTPEEEENDPSPPEVLCLVSQDREDEKLLQALEQLLYPLQRDSRLVLHHRGKIPPGEDYELTIQKWITQASVILLLASPAFLASDTCDQEMRQAMQQQTARVIPVLLRPSNWRHAPFARLTHLPSNDIPITRWPNRDQAWEEVTERICQVLDVQWHLGPSASPRQGVDQQSASTRAEAEAGKYRVENRQTTVMGQVVGDHATVHINLPPETALASQGSPDSGPSPSRSRSKRWFALILSCLVVLAVIMGSAVYLSQSQSGSRFPIPMTSPTPTTENTSGLSTHKTYPEQEGTLGSVTYRNPYNLSGEGPKVEAGKWVQVSCKVLAPTIQSASPNGYWYRIISNPWNNAYYAIANTFLNGDVLGHRPYTHNIDSKVPNC